MSDPKLRMVLELTTYEELMEVEEILYGTSSNGVHKEFSFDYPPDLLIQVVIIIDGIQLQPLSFQRIAPNVYAIYRDRCGVVEYFAAMTRTMLLLKEPFPKGSSKPTLYRTLKTTC